MEQNGRFEGEQPRTYGEESALYERQDKERAAGRTAGNQAGQGYGNAGGYGTPAGQSGGYGNQPGQAGSYGNAGGYGNQPGQPGGASGSYGNAGGYGTPAGQLGGYGNQPGQAGSYGNAGGYGTPAGQGYGNAGGYGNQPYGNQPTGGYGSQPYGPGYGNPYAGRQNPYGQPWHGQVKDVFCYILLAVMVLRQVIGIATSWIMFDVIEDYESLMNGTYVYQLMNDNMYSVLSNISSLLFIAYIVFVILDIVFVSKANYKVTGLILFAIFLTPGYYIWRTHVLGRKKTLAILFTVLLSILVLVNIGMLFTEVFSLTTEMMQSIYY